MSHSQLNQGPEAVSTSIPSLRDYKRNKGFLIGVDSDGSALDSMNLKHRRCFFPALVSVYHLESVQNEALKIWEKINLFSPSRGANRFRALAMAFSDLLKVAGVDLKSFPQIDPSPLEKWMASGSALSADGLKAWMKTSELNGDAKQTERACLQGALNWSTEVNRLSGEHTDGIKPFEGVDAALKSLKTKADIVVISQASTFALQEEWERTGLANYLDAMAGQEFGSKSIQLKEAMQQGFSSTQTLLIGDAPGDLEAAQDCHALFYPIIPGQEHASWTRLVNEAAPRFFSGSYAGAYADSLITEFHTALGI